MATRPDFLGLEAFVAVAERGNFRMAAAHLGITQTALSHRMRKLESYLGVSLLHKDDAAGVDHSMWPVAAASCEGAHRGCPKHVRGS